MEEKSSVICNRHSFKSGVKFLGRRSSVSYMPGSRNCAARQRALQIILDLPDKSSNNTLITVLIYDELQSASKLFEHLR